MVTESESIKKPILKSSKFTKSTSASKLNSYGGATEKISKMLFREVDSPVQEKSAIVN